MLTPIPVRWATAAATLILLPPSTLAASGAFERGPSAPASGSISSRTLPTAETLPHSRPLALGAQVLFVAGPRKNVRFRVNLRDGTLSTPSAPKLLEGVVDVVVAKRHLFLCQAASSVGLNIVGFDLETGIRIHDVGPELRATSTDATFCTHARQPQSPRSGVSPRLQNI